MDITSVHDPSGCTQIISRTLAGSTLKVERDLSFAELGQILEISEETAKKRFQRARTRLRQLLPDENL
jgi:hypothetical protein